MTEDANKRCKVYVGKTLYNLYDFYVSLPDNLKTTKDKIDYICEYVARPEIQKKILLIFKTNPGDKLHVYLRNRHSKYIEIAELECQSKESLEETEQNPARRRPGESPEHYNLRSKISSLKREETRCGWAQIRSKYQHMRNWYGERMVELRKEMAKLMGELKKLEAYEKDNPYVEPDNSPKPIEGRSLETLREKLRELGSSGYSHRDVSDVFEKYAPYKEITPHDEKLIRQSEGHGDEYPYPYMEAESIDGFEEIWSMMTRAYHRAERQAGIE